MPDREGRKEILQIHTRGMPIKSEIDTFGTIEKVSNKKIVDLIKIAIHSKRSGDKY